MVDVKVKPLEWQEAKFSDRWTRFTAQSVFGYYEVLEWSDGGFGGSMPADPMRDEDAPTEFSAASMDEAKAAAQADFESRILSALATPEAEPVGYPRILYVCEYCQENNPEMCGRDRDDLYVTPDGRWLCDSCLDEEGIPSSDCVSPPTLYTHPSPPIKEAEVEAALDATDFAANATSRRWMRRALTAALKARGQG